MTEQEKLINVDLYGDGSRNSRLRAEYIYCDHADVCSVYKLSLIHIYGDLVKYVCKTFFGWDGKKDEKGRTLLQRVGTDKIRAVSPDYWVDFIVSILDIFCDEWDYVLIPDTRFPNEYEIYETYGMDAILLRVVRPNFVSPLTEEQQKHA